MDNNLLNMFKSTYGGAVRDREAFANEQRSKQAATQLNEASALESMFRTKRGEQMLPSEVATANFEASPEMQQAKLGKSQAEAAKLKADSERAIMELSDDQIVQVYKQGIAVNKNILASAQSYLAAGYSVKDALAAVSSSLPEDKRNDPKFRQLIAQYSRMNPKQAAALIDQGLTQISEAEAKATDPNYIRQILTGKQQMDLEKVRGANQLAEARERTAGAKAGSARKSAAELLSETNDAYFAALEAGDKEKASKLLYKLNVLRKGTPDQPGFAGLPGEVGTELKPYSSGTNAPTQNPQKAAWMAAAKKANPKASEEELSNYYNSKYSGK